MRLSFPVGQEHIRSITDPQVDGAKTFYALVRATDLPTLPLDPDPRVPKIKGPVVRRISDSLASNRGNFHLLNRGITVSAKTAHYDNKTQVLTLELVDGDESYGILDGGHTDHAVRTTVDRMSQEERDALCQYVRLEIMVGVESHLADIAEARNYSVSLKPATLAAYRHRFDTLLNALGPEIKAHIRISENDEEPVSIVDVVQVLTSVNRHLFPESQAPVEAYKNAGKCLDWFIDEDDKYQYRSLFAEAPKILRLYDYCRLRWKDVYNSPDESGRRGKLGRTTEANQRKRNRVALSTYYFWMDETGKPSQSEYPIEKGFALPLLSGYRALMDRDENGSWRFYTDPFRFFDTHGKKLVTVVMNASDAAGNNAQVVGRDPQVYNNIYSEVRRWYLESQVRNPSGQGTLIE